MEGRSRSAAGGDSPQPKPEKDLFHVSHKIPSGDTPYVKAKHAQLVEKDAEAALGWFWKAISEGDRVESALKDMVVVMKQLDRTEEAIQAIISFRLLCSKSSQHSLDNLLLDLYKKCGRMDEHIELIKYKLRMIYKGEAFNGKPTKTARSHGKKFQVSIQQETSRLLGNMGWAYMQKGNFMAAEVVYKKAQMFDPDANKANNLGLCLMKQGRLEDARSVLEQVVNGAVKGSEDCKSRFRAQELMSELESKMESKELESRAMRSDLPLSLDCDDHDFIDSLESLIDEWAPPRSKRLPIFEEISSFAFRDQVIC